MPTLFISEFAGLQATPFVPAMPSAVLPALNAQTVAIGGASVASAAFGASTQLVRLMADTNCNIQCGATPTATATTTPLAANVPEYFQVAPGLKIAVISRA